MMKIRGHTSDSCLGVIRLVSSDDLSVTPCDVALQRCCMQNNSGLRSSKRRHAFHMLAFKPGKACYKEASTLQPQSVLAEGITAVTGVDGTSSPGRRLISLHSRLLHLVLSERASAHQCSSMLKQKQVCAPPLRQVVSRMERFRQRLLDAVCSLKHLARSMAKRLAQGVANGASKEHSYSRRTLCPSESMCCSMTASDARCACSRTSSLSSSKRRRRLSQNS